jgi:hypothetical protein
MGPGKKLKAHVVLHGGKVRPVTVRVFVHTAGHACRLET